MKATEVLMDEHKGILAMLDTLEKACEAIQAREMSELRRIEQILEFFSVFAHACHFGKEEDIFFPAVERLGEVLEGWPTSALRHEHVLVQGVFSGMRAPLKEFEKNPLNSVFRFLPNAREYIGLLRDHIREEEKVLFPMVDAHMSVGEQEHLSEEFGKIERSILNRCGKSLVRGEDGLPVLAASTGSPDTPEQGA